MVSSAAKPRAEFILSLSKDRTARAARTDVATAVSPMGNSAFGQNLQQQNPFIHRQFPNTHTVGQTFTYPRASHPER
jgi:hypothetical protein